MDFRSLWEWRALEALHASVQTAHLFLLDASNEDPQLPRGALGRNAPLLPTLDGDGGEVLSEEKAIDAYVAAHGRKLGIAPGS